MYKIVDTSWHVMNAYDMFSALKDDAEFYLIDNMHRNWNTDKFKNLRDIPENVHFVPYYEEGKYDFAILHVDQQCVNEKIGKRKVYMDLNEVIQDIPKVVMNHGTPVYPEIFKLVGMTDEDAEAEVISLMKELVGKNKMVVNSHDASKAWGWGYPIVHGMNPDMWVDLPKEPIVSSAISVGGLDEYYNRAVFDETMRLLDERGITLHYARQNVNTEKSKTAYQEFLGRTLLYFDPSIKTPMNRARTEAMLSGACVIQVEGAHDLDRFARPNENMLLVQNNPEKIASLIQDCLENRYDECVKIGQEGKKTALEVFNYTNLRKQWLDFIHNELGL